MSSTTSAPGTAPPTSPRVAVTLSAGGDSAGFEHVDLEHAAQHVAGWIRSIKPTEVGIDFRINVEILD